MSRFIGSAGRRFTVVGGAGFLGSHVVDRLLLDPATKSVTIYDNFSSAPQRDLEAHDDDHRYGVVKGDLADMASLVDAIDGADTVVHLAANPDIARAVSEPSIDFDQGTFLTHQVLEAARRCRVAHLWYASGSGVYGDVGDRLVAEDHGPLVPISTYGASKLASEAMIAAYCHLFDMDALVFRFANLVGPRQTHGVVFDFVRKLRHNSRVLPVLGDGSQSKSYLHVHDAVAAMVTAATNPATAFEVFNVATDDYLTVTQIARTVIALMGLENVLIGYTGGDRGWKGDVPVVRMDTTKIRRLGWTARWPSGPAVRHAVDSLLT